MIKISLFVAVLLLSGCGERTVVDTRCTDKVFDTLKVLGEVKDGQLKVVVIDGDKNPVGYVENGTKEQQRAFYEAKLNNAKAAIISNGLSDYMKNPKLIQSKPDGVSGYDVSLLHDYHYYHSMLGCL